MTNPIDLDRWTVSRSGGIEASFSKLTRGAAHADHIEMGGRSVNAIIKWRVSEAAKIEVERVIRWPMLREKKDDTHAAFTRVFDSAKDILPRVDGAPYSGGKAERFEIHGMLRWHEVGPKVFVTRTIFPSVSLPCLVEHWVVRNGSGQPVDVEIPSSAQDELLDRDLFAWASHRVRTEWIGSGRHRLLPGQVLETGMVFSAREDGQPALFPDLLAEWEGRQSFVRRLEGDLVLTTGDATVDRLFAFSKLRAAENVLATRGGLMHAPGGFNRYLAALWCNDQNEYVSPFFPFLGDPGGVESARNAYAWYARYMNPEYTRLPSSIIAEGRGTWQGAGDRGDAAMTAYGAARFGLASGDSSVAKEVWPLIEWCLEYCERQKTSDGVIASDSDELEGRFSSGKTNLATSALTYDALISAADLALAIGRPPEMSHRYRANAVALRASIENVFGATIAGFKTYRYHEGLEKLRAWICIPLVMDIEDRAKGTVAALLSPDLWTQDGLLTEPGTTTYWDRATLYALRGVFRAGEADKAAEYLSRYSRRRLLGDHVPYCQEAYPEQNQSHLSAESGLYCRILIEGACGIRPTGLSHFDATPQIPKSWKGLSLHRIRAFGRIWDYEASRRGKDVELIIRVGGNVCYRATKPQGAVHSVVLP